jgi:hypothetical protein
VNSWEEVDAVLRVQFEVVAGGGGWVEVRSSPDADSPPVRARVSTGKVLGREFVAIVAEVFAAAELDAELALAINHALPFGSLELGNGTYFVRAMLAIAGLTAFDLELAVKQICLQAAHMKRPRGGASGASGAFGHWNE